MEPSAYSLLSLSPNPTSQTEPFSSSPHHTCPSSRLLLPLSPISFPPSPNSLSPAAAESVHSSSLLSYCAAQAIEEQCAQNMSPASDQDDLTCLSWLHQRCNLLPYQPLHKVPLLPLNESTGSAPSASSKPPYSFSSLIFMAIEDSPGKKLPVKDIYEWIVKNFPYYKTATGGWRNSVRHNLSLSKSFCRIQRDKSQSVGKGSLWCVCPEYRPGLLEVLRKTHSYHSTNSNLLNKPELFEEGDYSCLSICDTVEISDSLSNSILLSNSQSLSTDISSFSESHTCHLSPSHEELVTMESVDYQQEEVCEEKDPLSDCGYIELHYYHTQEYLVLPGDHELDLETVEILQLDAEAQEAAGSLLDLAGGGY
ncbi:unnamed protein product [Knipowitschia caucasica]